MTKTDIKKSKSEDIAELCDEALDRATGMAQACPVPPATVGGCHACFSPAD
ncbi:MAG: hypothetical protein ISR48_04635 [Alphaproteobacteria bacterium]|nr:hypothetical protein [Alphaproteobacteria bacterium]